MKLKRDVHQLLPSLKADLPSICEPNKSETKIGELEFRASIKAVPGFKKFGGIFFEPMPESLAQVFLFRPMSVLVPGL
ncbi:MAG: hypothetical protein ACFB10_10645 [Salibacteraceae bacterium]